MRADADRLLDILEAIDAIQKEATSRADFDANKMVRVWCLHHIVVIGEAAARVSEALRARHSEVPWRRVVAMRNAVVHGYFQVDWDEVWNVVEREMAPLRRTLGDVLATEKNEA